MTTDGTLTREIIERAIRELKNAELDSAYICYRYLPEPVILPPLPHTVRDCLKQLGRLFLLAIW